MSNRFPPVTPNRPFILHGGDYNPEQWLDYPQILDRDISLMKQAHVNVCTVGVFSWAMYEPREGEFQFGWMDGVLDRLADNGIVAVLATPSGAKPHWMARKYPQICRIDRHGRREPQGHRHNHCMSSPDYREKCTIMNTRLAERYGKHPAVAMWHVSNEYGGECHCDLCKSAFRKWLRERYETLDRLNHAYWSRFWSHQYGDWDEIDHIDATVHGLVIDWKRFMTHQTVDFFRHESAPLRKLTPNLPITVNMMGTYEWLDYWKFAPHVDVISWDAYPGWHHGENDLLAAQWTAFTHDLNRSLKQRPFMLIESTPSITNWQDVSPVKRPGAHKLTSLQALAHGSDSVMYFQWRKSRGSYEKFHGAVVDHDGSADTRTFREVAELGGELAKLGDVVGTMGQATAAVIFDWENRWAVNASAGPRNVDKDVDKTAVEHHAPLWRRGVATDVISADQPLDGYKLVIAPMLYMIRPGVAERLAAFVETGGTLIATYLTGWANESDLCFLGGFPGGKDSPLRRALGVWVEETDALPAHRRQSVIASGGAGLSGSYAARHYCDLLHLEGAEALATYEHDFYAGRPAVTVNRLGRGRAFYVGSRLDERFLDDLISHAAADLPRATEGPLPEGVTATTRGDFLFVLNFTPDTQTIDLGRDHASVLDGKKVKTLVLEGYGYRVFRR